MSARRRVVIVPGNGAGCASANFYPWLAAALRARGHEVLLREMPDADRARRRVWAPFIAAELVRGDARCVLVGHSSGALAALRHAEAARVHALVLVSATPSDLGDANERASGWYDGAWRWDLVRAHARRVVLFASDDDPFIPLALQREVRDGLAAAARAGATAVPPHGGAAAGGPSSSSFEYVELSGRSHFFDEEQPEILEAVGRLAAEADEAEAVGFAEADGAAAGSGGGGGGGDAPAV
jgi:predicted alpha/beta hydrolase family esterase